MRLSRVIPILIMMIIGTATASEMRPGIHMQSVQCGEAAKVVEQMQEEEFHQSQTWGYSTADAALTVLWHRWDEGGGHTFRLVRVLRDRGIICVIYEFSR